MALTDNILIPLTAKKIGPGNTPARGARAKVFYLKPSDLQKAEPDTVRGNAIIKVGSARSPKKVELLESPNELIAAQALAQGATAQAYFAANWQALTPTSSATYADMNAASRYLNDVTTINGGYIKMPDPFTRRLAVVFNQTTGSILARAQNSTATINGSTGSYTIAAGKRVHFTAPTAATAGTTAGWKVATDV